MGKTCSNYTKEHEKAVKTCIYKRPNTQLNEKKGKNGSTKQPEKNYQSGNSKSLLISNYM